MEEQTPVFDSTDELEITVESNHVIRVNKRYEGMNEFEIAMAILDSAGRYCMKKRDREATRIFTEKIAELVTERSQNFGL